MVFTGRLGGVCQIVYHYVASGPRYLCFNNFNIMSLIHRVIPLEAFGEVPTNSLAAFITITLALYGLYEWLLPKPVLGIAYNSKATRSLLGDAPDMIREVSMTGEFCVWSAKQVKKMDSPICQVFVRPFSKPWIFLADFRESRDILTRRKEFDRSSFVSDGWACTGSFHGLEKTGDKYKAKRQLIQDLMTASFLNNYVGPAVYNKGLEVMKLFETKMNLANGRPFSVNSYL